ncbi:LysM peptidoglycan-binding domain-containing protein [Bacillus sp. 2205SS5-2]|uniref:LysM peptidoglycan-binding domain-containing protein n=1 Tax=Bacillus sp. 2205SS5-2 TaxID=3109031 RepID=UPI0030070826
MPEHKSQAQKLRGKMEGDGSEKLPPRSEVHKDKKQKTKVKIKYPLLRMLLILFIVLPIGFFVAYSKWFSGAQSLSIPSTRNAEVQIISGKTEKEFPSIEEVGKSRTTIPKKTKPSIPVEENNQETDNEKTTTNEGTTGNAGGDKNLPDKGTISASSSDKSDQPKQVQVSYLYHVVQPNETLYRISVTYYGNGEKVDSIRQHNHLQGNEIKEGETLKIPMNQ